MWVDFQEMLSLRVFGSPQRMGKGSMYECMYACIHPSVCMNVYIQMPMKIYLISYKYFTVGSHIPSFTSMIT